MKILILDDDQNRLNLFKQKLIGHDVICVETAKDAIIELKKNKFNIISLDHDLGGKVMVESGEGTGWEVAKFLHDYPQIINHALHCGKQLTGFITGNSLKCHGKIALR